MKRCARCDRWAHTDAHHIVPRSRGGTETVPLCHECHMLIHDHNVPDWREWLLKPGETRERPIDF